MTQTEPDDSEDSVQDILDGLKKKIQKEKKTTDKISKEYDIHIGDPEKADEGTTKEQPHGTTWQGDTNRIPRYDYVPSEQDHNEVEWGTYGGDYEGHRYVNIPEEVFESPTITDWLYELIEKSAKCEVDIDPDDLEQKAEEKLEEAEKKGEFQILGKEEQQLGSFLIGSVAGTIITGDPLGGGASAVVAYEIIYDSLKKKKQNERSSGRGSST